LTVILTHSVTEIALDDAGKICKIVLPTVIPKLCSGLSCSTVETRNKINLLGIFRPSGEVTSS